MYFVIVLKEDISGAKNLVKKIKTAVREAGGKHEFKTVSRLNLHWKDLADADCVFSVGGDGTLFRTTHYIKTGKIIGIHASDISSRGHFMAFEREEDFTEVTEYLTTAMDLEATNRYFDRLLRLKSEINQATGDVLTCNRAVNDYFIGNDVAGYSSRYRISMPMCEEEVQRSSGIICSTYQGMTGWAINLFRHRKEIFEEIMADYKRKKEEYSAQFFYVVSQPMENYQYEYGFTNQLTIVSEMAGGVVTLDGFTRINFDRKDEVNVRVSSHPVWVMKRPK